MSDFLEEHGIIGIEGIDTRALVRRTREQGAMKGILSTIDHDDASLVAKAKASPGLIGRDLTREVMPAGVSSWEGRSRPQSMLPPLDPVTQKAVAVPVEQPPIERRPHVVALDFGMKRNILRHLVEIGCRVTVLPGSEPARAILDVRARRHLHLQRPG